MIKRLPEIIAIIFILIAIYLGIHQVITTDDTIFNLRQIWHHETLIAVFGFGAVCLLAGKYLGKIDR
ncbi:MAG: hypothetical protein PVG61_05555 [Dehalococcoidia bacterium]